jgi:hypothetical protein
MIDSPENVKNKSSSLLPTRENIIKQIQELVLDAVPGDRFFFFCASSLLLSSAVEHQLTLAYWH